MYTLPGLVMVSTFFGFRSPSKPAVESTGAAAEGIQLTDLPVRFVLHLAAQTPWMLSV